MPYPDTYYRRTMAEDRPRAALAGPVDCDTVVIGGGLAGLTTSLQLARGGQAVVLLEADRVGFGASGRNGGFVSPGFSTGNDEIARKAGKDVAAKLFQLSVEGVEFIRDTIRTLGIDSAAPMPGITSVLRYDDGPSLRAYREQLLRDHGFELDYLETDQVRAVLRSERYFQALRNPHAFHMHPLNYLRALAAEIERLGSRIYETSAATATDLSGPEKQVRTASGEVRARHVVFTTGGYTGNLEPRLRRAFLPIATYVMVSEEAPELIAAAIATRDAIGDNRRAGDYYRLVDGGRRILWGGRITTRAAATEGLVRELRREMIGTYPQLAELRTELAWSGLMSYARHLMPQIGAIAPCVWHCTAFGGHGLNTTALGGKVVAEAILGQSERYRLFRPFGLDWAGGAAGLAVAQLTYWRLQAQDWWRERAA
ncbi:MAG: FAD-binding oxidoreductase [Rhizobium sp.]|nr:FAD-binding oxidoreductase [Rhizobium sp.]